LTDRERIEITARLAAACGPITIQIWLGDKDGGTRTMTAEEYVTPIVNTLAHHGR
jgi:hypothetical protein